MKALAREDLLVIGVDSINDYYAPQLKIDRLDDLGFHEVELYNINIADTESVSAIFDAYQIDAVINLAAQAGVRYSLTHPEKYIQANILGFFNLIDCAKRAVLNHFVYASKLEVYGLIKKMQLAAEELSRSPDITICLYAATKKSNELFAHSYSHLYNLPTTGLRFFTVYGPWGRPDMAYFKFTQSILKGKQIDVYNHGDMYRDFTYIADIVEGIKRALYHIPTGNKNWDGANPDPSSSPAPYRVFNIGNHTPIKLLDFIQILEQRLGQKANIHFMPMQPGDVYKTFADVSHLQKEVGYKPNTTLVEGIDQFVNWYNLYYNS
ncbi:UNVERIFIED_CONTAM: hypothetical protein GTU68_051101 [Idotea baltica]|nr:hypothetical protein [Idotea baltica]